MRHLGLGVGHKKGAHGNDDDESMEVDFLDIGVHHTPELNDYDSEHEINGTQDRDEEEDEEEDSEEEGDLDDEETGGDDEEQEGVGSEDELEDNGYDEL